MTASTTTAAAPLCGACSRPMGDGDGCCLSVEDCDAYVAARSGPELLGLLRLSIGRHQRGQDVPSRRALETPRGASWPDQPEHTGPALVGRGRLRTRWRTAKCTRCDELYDPAGGSGAVCPGCRAETGRRHA